MKTLEHLITYTQWANRRWFDFITKNCAGDDFMVQMIAHIARGERAWFQRLFGETLDRTPWNAMTLAEIRDQFVRNADSYSKLQRRDLTARIDFVRSDGSTGSARSEDIVLHLCLRADHHRAKLAEHLAKKNTPAPVTDFLEYTRTYSPQEIPRE